jgi:hypothetical protein
MRAEIGERKRRHPSDGYARPQRVSRCIANRARRANHFVGGAISLSSHFFTSERNFPVHPVGQIKSITPAVPSPRGALAIVTDVGWDAVDAAASARSGVAGRVPRERSTGAQDERRQSPAKPFGEDGWLRTAKACGPGTRCWCQVGGGFVGPTGFDKTANSPTTVTRRIRRRGERAISRKAIAQGMPECLR